MILLPVQQNSEEWRDFRRGKIGGTASNTIHPPKTGKNKEDITATATFWRLLGERISVGKDAEPETDRGHRLEPIGVEKTNNLYKLDLVWGTEEHPEFPGVWVSDINDKIYVSPDAAERGDKPTYAAEVKAFDTGKHLQIIYKDRIAKKLDGYNPINSIPVENHGQLADYFVVNEHLKIVYWTLVNDMVAYENLEHYVIEVRREDIAEQIDILSRNQSIALISMQQIIERLIDNK